MAVDLCPDRLCQGSPASFNDDINVLALTAKETVPDIASYDKSPDSHFRGSLRNYLEYFIV